MRKSRSTGRSRAGLWRLLAALAVFSLLAAACGDDEDAAPEPAPAPAEEAPAEEAPAEEAPAEEAPTEEMPAEEAPAEEMPAEEAPAEEMPAEEAPAEEAPAEAGGIPRGRPRVLLEPDCRQLLHAGHPGRGRGDTRRGGG